MAVLASFVLFDSLCDGDDDDDDVLVAGTQPSLFRVSVLSHPAEKNTSIS